MNASGSQQQPVETAAAAQTATALEPESSDSLSGQPMWLHSTERTPAAEAFGPTGLAPCEAKIVAVGRHLWMSAVAWISENNEIIVAVKGHWSDVGCEVHVRVWTLAPGMLRKVATFHASEDHAVAHAVMGTWTGRSVSGIVLVPVMQSGEER